MTGTAVMWLALMGLVGATAFLVLAGLSDSRRPDHLLLASICGYLSIGLSVGLMHTFWPCLAALAVGPLQWLAMDRMDAIDRESRTETGNWTNSNFRFTSEDDPQPPSRPLGDDVDP